MAAMLAHPITSSKAHDGTEPISNPQTLSRSYTNPSGQVVRSDACFNLSGVTCSTAGKIGVSSFFGLPAPTWVKPWATTMWGGRLLGRWLPVIGWVMLAYDAMCLYAWAAQNAPPDTPLVDGMTVDGKLRRAMF